MVSRSQFARHFARKPVLTHRWTVLCQVYLGGDSEPTLSEVFLAIFVAYQMASSGDQGLWHHLHTCVPRIYHNVLSLEGA